MAIKKIKLPDNTTEDINDPRLPAVTTTDNGKLLGVDGGIWSKVNKPSYTLDDVADGSTRKLANYLPLTGGTISNANYGQILTVYRNSSSGDSTITFQNSASVLGYIGVTSGGAPCFRDTSATTHTIYHSGNSNLSTVDWAAKTLTLALSALSPKYCTNGAYGLAKGSTISGGMTDNDGCLYYPGQLLRTYATTYDVQGNITASGTITPGSDTRIKDNQEEIASDHAFEILENLNPKSWTWNEDAGENLVGKKAAGLVAQEVKEVLPEAVNISKTDKFEDFHSLNYNTIQGYEIAAIKGLIEEVKSLKAEIAELKKQIK